MQLKQTKVKDALSRTNTSLEIGGKGSTEKVYKNRFKNNLIITLNRIPNNISEVQNTSNFAKRSRDDANEVISHSNNTYLANPDNLSPLFLKERQHNSPMLPNMRDDQKLIGSSEKIIFIDDPIVPIYRLTV